MHATTIDPRTLATTTYKQPLARLGWKTVRYALQRAYDDHAQAENWTHNHWRLLEQIARLTWYHAHTHPGHRAYATPSELWLANRLSVARETVSRLLRELATAELLTITRRRPSKGRWSTNLYRAGQNLMSALWRAAFAIRDTATRRASAPQSAKHSLSVTPTSHGQAPGLCSPSVHTTEPPKEDQGANA